jgi:hypothetical protein
MFHVKPFSTAPLAMPRRDVSRETFMRKSTRAQEGFGTTDEHG